MMKTKLRLIYIVLLISLSIPVLFAQEISDKVHAFYYPWYGNPQTDGHWMHWDHPIVHKPGFPKGQYSAPENIGANFYPALGCYSTQDPKIIDHHMQQFVEAGVGVLSTSWWGKNSQTDDAVPLILQIAEKYNIKVNFHIEPYPDRNALSTKKDIEYIINQYGSAPAFYRTKDQKNLPLFYIYDSYLTPADDWAEVLSPDGKNTIRNSTFDSIIIGLYVKKFDHRFMDAGYFDGFYTYFATEGFTYGSTPANWQSLADYAKKSEKIFIPSVGPGYIDTRIRPWNDKNTRSREDGGYYNRMWQSALDNNPAMISITSFNEWHEGTQIETTIPKVIDEYTYLDFSPLPPNGYLTLTRKWVETFLSHNQ